MRRVVITGIGLVTPIGTGKSRFWEAALAGENGVAEVESFDTAAFPVHRGAEVRNFSATQYLEVLQPSQIGRAAQLAVAAAHLALMDGAVDLTGYSPTRVGITMGTTSGEPLFVEQYNDLRHEQGLGAVPAETLNRYPCHTIPGNLARELGIAGPNLMIPTACAAGNYAIGHAFDLIRSNRTDLMLAGGADAFSRITYMGFARLGAIAPECCQPFDRDRKGMIPGEGAAVVVLEEAESALLRGAHIYAEIAGYGISCDAYHMTAADPQGDGAIRAMQMAMEASRVEKDEIDYISAHGTGTPSNDRVESIAVQRLFGSKAGQIPMSSIKSMIGHTMGAASAIEAAACALAIDTGMVPPTINHHQADPEFQLDFVPNQSRRVDPKVVLNNAYAFGGNNASLCLSRWQR